MAFINKKTAVTIFSLVLLAVIYILSVRQDELEQTQANPNITSFVSCSNVFSNYNSNNSYILSSNGNNKFTVADNDLPSFKSTRQSEENMEMATEVDFQRNRYNSEKSKKKYKNQDISKEIKSDVDSISFHARNQHVVEVETSHFQRVAEGKYATQNKYVNNNFEVELAKVSMPIASQIVSNTTSESFIANNSLTISNDFTNNTGPKYVDETSMPGDPGVIPIGDAFLPLMLFLMMYRCWKVIKIY